MAGKEYSIVVLSSSPPAPDAYNSPPCASPRRVAMPPSSPLALSPPSSPKNYTSGVLTSGSRAVPIPEKASRGFATVSSLVRSEHFAQEHDDQPAEVQQALGRGRSRDITEQAPLPVKKAVGRPKKVATATEDLNPKPKPKPKPRARKPKADKEGDNLVTADPELRVPRSTRSPFFDNAPAHNEVEKPSEATLIAPKLTKSGKPRKPRTKKAKPEDGDAESKPKKTRVTKPKGAAAARAALTVEADVVSAHFGMDQAQAVEKTSTTADDEHCQGNSIWNVPQSPRLEQAVSNQRPLDLEEAVSRRRDWTPPRDTVAQSPSTVSTGKENMPHPDKFTHLISNFTYASPSAKVREISATTTTATTTTTKDTSVTKRRRGELVELPGVQIASRASSPEKGKAPKKKPRTITDLVTGQYATKDDVAAADAITSDFFSPRTTTSKVPLNDVAPPDADDQLKRPVRRRSKAKDGSEKPATKAKPRAKKPSTKAVAKVTPVAEKLLSPTSAVMRMNRQEVLFGTSSQLALEESPTTVRHIQRAIRESEKDEGIASNHQANVPPRWPKLQRVEGRRGLWRESTRDGDGGLLHDTENVYIPAPDRTQDLPLLIDVASGTQGLPSEFVDIDDIAPRTPIAISSDLPTPPESQSQKKMEDPLPVLSPRNDVFDDIDDFGSELPPSNQNVESQNSFVDIDDFHSASLTSSHHAPPNAFKPSASAPPVPLAATSKRRGRPPKSKSAIPVRDISAAGQVQETLQPQTLQRSLSTPPKGSGRFIDIEEILDSEDEVLEAFSPTPPRVRKLQDSPPLPLAFNQEPLASVGRPDEVSGSTAIFRILTSQLEWQNIKPSICSAITTHIRSLPPTTDPKQPSWYEKILMYDPIILEDFTTYLINNTKLHTYKRATQKQIKAYNNELKMAGNAILGTERDDQVLAIAKDLEVYMVRDWCQEMSICCIHAKESRGRGSARKGFY